MCEIFIIENANNNQETLGIMGTILRHEGKTFECEIGKLQNR
jgi:hypothetical protein